MPIHLPTATLASKLNIPALTSYSLPQVRCLSPGPEPGTLISGGQDAALRVWSLPTHAAIADAALSLSYDIGSGGASPPSPQVQMLGRAIQHSYWVVSCCALPPGLLPSLLPYGGIASGCQDGKIRVYRSCEGEGAEDEVFVLEGHRKGVISLSLTSRGHLLSGTDYVYLCACANLHIYIHTDLPVTYTCPMHGVMPSRLLGRHCAAVGPPDHGYCICH
jgi:WD40 repeat protein